MEVKFPSYREPWTSLPALMASLASSWGESLSLFPPRGQGYISTLCAWKGLRSGPATELGTSVCVLQLRSWAQLSNLSVEEGCCQTPHRGFPLSYFFLTSDPSAHVRKGYPRGWMDRDAEWSLNSCILKWLSGNCLHWWLYNQLICVCVCVNNSFIQAIFFWCYHLQDALLAIGKTS